MTQYTNIKLNYIHTHPYIYSIISNYNYIIYIILYKIWNYWLIEKPLLNTYSIYYIKGILLKWLILFI